MTCVKCAETVGLCKCADIDERLESFKGSAHVLLAYCPRCGHYILRCTCVDEQARKQ